MISKKLDQMIKEHQNLKMVIEKESQALETFNKAQTAIRNFLINSNSIINAIKSSDRDDFLKTEINKQYETLENQLTSLALNQKVHNLLKNNAALFAELLNKLVEQKVFFLKEFEKLSRINEIDNTLDKLYHDEDFLVRGIFEYNCKSLEDMITRAEYIISNETMLQYLGDYRYSIALLKSQIIERHH